MARDIVQEAVEQAEAMKEAAYENAKSVLVDAMSTNLKAAVSQAIGENIDEAGNPKGADVNVNYDPEGIQKLDGDDLTDEGDGPAIIEAGLEEDDEYGGGKGDESRSRRDYEGDDEEDENEGDEYGGGKGDESKSRRDFEEGDEYGGGKGDESRSQRDYEAALEDDEEDDVDIDIDVDDDDDEDIDEVLEIIEDDDEDVDVDVDVDDDEDDELEERGMLNKKVEAAVKENRQLRRENRRYEKALTFLKKRIDEVNLFNARLAAASDLMRKVSLTKTEKERVVEHFDRARTIGEVKRTFRALTEGYTASNRTVKKQRVGRPNVQSVISEDQKQSQDRQYSRLAELAGI
jgi:hypothetical protein